MSHVITPAVIPALPVRGSADTFPVRRVYCVGRNYADHAIEMGHDPNKEEPFFFQKNPDNLTTGDTFPYPGMTEMLALIAAHGIKAEDVERVDVGTNHNMQNALIHRRPRNELQAKFSMEFCMAILLLDGRANLPEFTDETVLRDDVRALIERIHFAVHPEAEAAGYAKMTTLIDIHMKDGRTISGRADFGKGSPANPMSYDEVADKFRGCAEFAGWPKDKSDAIIDLVATLDTAAGVKGLTAALRA